jgi:hypothetical protein
MIRTMGAVSCASGMARRAGVERPADASGGGECLMAAVQPKRCPDRSAKAVMI